MQPVVVFLTLLTTVLVCLRNKQSELLRTSQTCTKIWFCAEQLSLVLQSRPRYSNDILLWACSIFYSSPSCYNVLHESGVVTLPHPMYLRKLSLGSAAQDQENSHEMVLKETIKKIKRRGESS